VGYLDCLQGAWAKMRWALEEAQASLRREEFMARFSSQLLQPGVEVTCLREGMDHTVKEVNHKAYRALKGA